MATLAKSLWSNQSMLNVCGRTEVEAIPAKRCLLCRPAVNTVCLSRSLCQPLCQCWPLTWPTTRTPPPGLLIDVNGHIHPVSKVSKGDGVKSGEFSLRNWTHRQVIHTTLFTASASLAEWAPSARMVKVNAPTLTLADLVTALPTPAPNGAQPVPA